MFTSIYPIAWTYSKQIHPLKASSCLLAWFGAQEGSDTLLLAFKMEGPYVRTGPASRMWEESLKAESSPRPGARKKWVLQSYNHK